MFSIRLSACVSLTKTHSPRKHPLALFTGSLPPPSTLFSYSQGPFSHSCPKKEGNMQSRSYSKMKRRKEENDRGPGPPKEEGRVGLLSRSTRQRHFLCELLNALVDLSAPTARRRDNGVCSNGGEMRLYFSVAGSLCSL